MRGAVTDPGADYSKEGGTLLRDRLDLGVTSDLQAPLVNGRECAGERRGRGENNRGRFSQWTPSQVSQCHSMKVSGGR